MKLWALLRRLSGDEAFHGPFLAASALLIFLGRPSAFVVENYDGAYYAQKAKEMLAAGSFWVVPYHGEPSFDNAPFALWALALAFRLFGVSAYAAVLPTALFGVATVLLTYRFSLALFRDRGTALLAGLVLLFPGYFVDYARRPMLDVALTFWVTAALFCFHRALASPRWFPAFGLCTALGILTKSVLGAFPLLIGFATLGCARRSDVLRSPLFWCGVALALGLGSSWYAVNALRFGQAFGDVHFGWLLFERGWVGAGDGAAARDPLFFLATLRLLAANTWPWLPFALLGAWRAARRAWRERSAPDLLVLLWIAVPLAVMSASRTQLLRYVLPVFPALALLTSGFFGEVLAPPRRLALQAILLAACAGVALFVAATPIPVPRAVSLAGRGSDIAALAPAVRLNTPPQAEVGNYLLPAWNPRNAVLFYADRYLGDPIGDPVELLLRLQEDPRGTWLTRVAEFHRLEEEFPQQLYLIQSSGPYALFTSARARERVRYDFP